MLGVANVSGVTSMTGVTNVSGVTSVSGVKLRQESERCLELLA